MKLENVIVIVNVKRSKFKNNCIFIKLALLLLVLYIKRHEVIFKSKDRKQNISKKINIST